MWLTNKFLDKRMTVSKTFVVNKMSNKSCPLTKIDCSENVIGFYLGTLNTVHTAAITSEISVVIIPNHLRLIS
jgi:hypothetical protein